MYLKTPKMFNRPMTLIKKYKHHVLFMDKNTGIRQCFQYWDLTHEIIDNKIYKYTKNGFLVPVSKEQNNDLRKNPKLMLKNDNRFLKLIDNYFKERV